LQDQAVAYGFDRSRFYENKRAVTDKELGPLIKTVMTRCINCTRCVRFAEEIAGTPVLGQMHRGEDAEIGTFIDQLVQTELSGNLIDVCPVGALTSKPYAFKARPWELSKTETIDVMDALGCNIRVDVRGREVMRILPRLHEDINEEWINDRTRFAYDGLNNGRLDRPYIRDEKTGKLREVEWAEAFIYIRQRMQGIQPQEMAALVGDLADLESIVALKDLMGALGSPNLDCRTDGALFDTAEPAGYLFNSTIAGIEEADAVLLIGTNPRWEATLVNARILKAVNERDIAVGVVGEALDLGYEYHHVGSTLADLEKMVAQYKGAKMKAQKPLWIIGSGVFERPDGAALHRRLYELATELGIVKDNWNGFNVLHRAASRAGALLTGFTPQAGGKDFAQILEGTKNGSVKALYLLGADEFDAKTLIGWTTFVIYQGHHGDAGAARADVFLPGAAYTEKDGIYVNTEGRPQLARKAASPPGQAREDWTIIRALSEVLGRKLPYDTASQLRTRIAAEWPALVAFDQPVQAPWAAFGGKGDVDSRRAFVSPLKNFYLTNAITRASQTMQECTHSLLQSPQKAKATQMEAAE
jgi:NADH-quinone oxidoreductase subunit G